MRRRASFSNPKTGLRLRRSTVSVTPSTPIQRRAFLLDCRDDWKPRKSLGRKRRSSEEIKRLVFEFEASGLRQNEFCRNHGLALTRGRTTTTTTAAWSTPTTA